MTYKPRHRAETALDRADAQLAARRQASSERNKKLYKKAERPYCYGVEDGMDGYVVHTPACRNYQDMAVSSHPGCIDYRSGVSHGEVARLIRT